MKWGKFFKLKVSSYAQTENVAESNLWNKRKEKNKHKNDKTFGVSLEQFPECYVWTVKKKLYNLKVNEMHGQAKDREHIVPPATQTRKKYIVF